MPDSRARAGRRAVRYARGVNLRRRLLRLLHPLRHRRRVARVRAFEAWAGLTPASVVLELGFADEPPNAAALNNPLSRFGRAGRVVGVGLDLRHRVSRPVDLVRGDALRLPLASRSVDFVFSNSLIEHVGTREDQRVSVQECLRVARRGVFIATPNKLFPIEQHYLVPLLQWLPSERLQRALVRRTGGTWDPSVRLLTPAAFRRMLPPSAVLRGGAGADAVGVGADPPGAARAAPA